MDSKDADLALEQIKLAAQKVAETALIAIRNRSYSERHPELGKMLNCQICGLRHRQNERHCKQRFIVGPYESRKNNRTK